MSHIWIITESTKTGIDVLILNGLIKSRALLPDNSFEIITQDKIKAERKGGLSDIKGFLKDEIAYIESITNGSIKRVLIIADCDDKGATERYNEIRDCIPKKIFSLPSKIATMSIISQNKLQTGIYLHPNSKNKGSLETLIWKYFTDTKKDRKEIKYVDNLFKNLKKNTKLLDGKTSNYVDKLKVKTLSLLYDQNQYVKIVSSIDYSAKAFDKLSSFISQFA